MKISKHLTAILTAALLLTAAPATAAEKLTVLLDWFVNPDHAPLIIAKEKGFFKNHGLDVDTKTHRSTATASLARPL